MKFLMSLAFLATASASGASWTYIPLGTPFDYSASFTGSGKCALINMIMDESGSMGGDQAFMMSPEGMPKVAKALLDDGYDHVFMCSTGYGDVFQVPRFHGCTTADDWGPNPTAAQMYIMDTWIYHGAIEDSYNATMAAIENVPQVINNLDINQVCKGLRKNIILVTDEDRDIIHQVTMPQVLANVDSKGYVLNAIVNIEITSLAASNDILGISQTADQLAAGFAELLEWDGASSYSVIRGDFTLRSKNGDSVNHYAPMILGRKGAIWDIAWVRSAAHVAAMSEAIKDIKLKEINSTPENGPIIPGSGGDPHFKTWKGEHYEYHGQCDMVIAKDAGFDNGAGLDIHIRSKIVRFWSYIKNAAVRIGNDILEVEGSAEPSDTDNHYYVNFEYQGELTEIGGFPVSVKIQSPVKRSYEIDLDKQYPGAKIVISTYKEFVRVSFEGAAAESFGNTVGLMGDFKTGKTLARDGATVLDDFSELGNEWQVMPSEPKLFHEIDHPQFPEKCIEPEDPRGERRRRLAENSVTEEQAEAACARLSDAADRKDCVYDILATQDMGMVGAY